MYDHVGLRVRDLETSLHFYATALMPLGHVLGPRDETSAGFGPPGNPALWLHAAEGAVGRGVHLAFQTVTRDAVACFHVAGLQADGHDNGGPGLRPNYGPAYY